MKHERDPGEQAREFAASTMHQHGEALQRFLRGRVARPQDLGDLVQEVYLRLLRVRKHDEVLNPLAYVYGIAANVASEFQMRERRDRTVYDSELMQTAADAPAELPDGEGGAYFEHQVNQALAALPPMRLAVLLLERREGLSQPQIAEKLGLSAHTVKKYSVEALAHVRASLQR
ncbi:MAG: RNA polymerase sigma factor [Luteimonas sp.]|nr:RNA polymerase sigma factor [Luteimonas sp.]